MQASEPGAWASQGPEGFDDQKAGGNKSKIVATVVAVILLGGVAFGAYWLWGRGDGATSPAASTAAQNPAPQASPTQQPEDDLPVAKLPGASEKHPEVKSFSDVPALNYLNDDELRVYEATAPEKTKFRVQHFDNGNLGVFLLVKTNGADHPEEVEQKLADIQITNGAESNTEAPAGVAATRFEKQDDSLAQIRAHYFSGDIFVRVEIISKESLESASTQFDSVIKKQLQELPADD